jgi:hypothetical protein
MKDKARDRAVSLDNLVPVLLSNRHGYMDPGGEDDRVVEHMILGAIDYGGASPACWLRLCDW